MSTSPSTDRSSLSGMRDRWQTFSERDRRAIILASVALGAYLLWVIGIQPAMKTLNKAPTEILRLEEQLQRMNRMAQESRELRSIAPVSPAQATASLQAATDRLGSQGRITIQGDRATLTVSDIKPQALKDWLNEARSAGRARPLEAQLSKTARGYSGTILLAVGGNS